MKRVLVIGSGGAGKSTFSRRLGELLGVEVIHLDVEHWLPGWAEPSKAEWRARVEELTGRESWVMDGNYSGTLDVRLAACDTVVLLDLPRAVCLWRVVKRLVVYRKRRRPDMAEGCGEKFDVKFLRWVWDYPKRTRPTVLKLIAECEGAKDVHRLRTRAEVERFLEGVAARARRGEEKCQTS